MPRQKKVKIDPSFYTPTVTAMVFTLPEARAEYSRLRKIASKRLQRLAGSGYAGSGLYGRYSGAFSPLARGASESAVRKKLYEVARFLGMSTSSVSGMREARKQTISSLKDRGYDFINESNLDLFGQYMSRVKSYAASKLYDSEEIIDLFHDALEKGVDPMLLADDFGDFIEDGIPEDMIPPLTADDEDALDGMRGDQQEPIPGERPSTKKKPSRRKSAVEKTAEKNRKKAEKRNRTAKRRRRK